MDRCDTIHKLSIPGTMFWFADVNMIYVSLGVFEDHIHEYNFGMQLAYIAVATDSEVAPRANKSKLIIDYVSIGVLSSWKSAIISIPWGVP